jgi:hypothetical protein
MKTTRLVIAVLGCAFFAAGAPGQHPRTKLDMTIKEAIRVLKAKQYEHFLRWFAIPEEFKKKTELISSRDLANQFGKDKARELLAVLESIQGETPLLSDEGKMATFKVKKELSDKGSIRFRLIEKFWYIQNK